MPQIVLTEYQAVMLQLASERESGIAKGDIPAGYRHRQRGAWWRNLDQLEARGLVQRIGHRYVATPRGDLALSGLTEDRLRFFRTDGGDNDCAV